MVTDLENSIESFNSRPDQAEEGINKLKDRAVEFIQLEKQKGKRMERVMDLLDTIKQTKMEIPEGEERKREKDRKLTRRNNG